MLTHAEGEYKEEGGAVYRHGQGKYNCAVSNTIYTGNWEMDVMSGKGMRALHSQQGKLEFASGAFYEVRLFILIPKGIVER